MTKGKIVKAQELRKTVASKKEKWQLWMKSEREKNEETKKRDLNERVKTFVENFEKDFDERLVEEAKRERTSLTVMNGGAGDKEFVHELRQALLNMCQERDLGLKITEIEPEHQNDPLNPSYTLTISW